MRRVAVFEVVIESDLENEDKVHLWLAVMADALDKFAAAASEEIPEVKVVELMTAGQSIPVGLADV